jgi:hypothetical protein
MILALTIIGVLIIAAAVIIFGRRLFKSDT